MELQELLGYAFGAMPYGLAMALALALLVLLISMYRSPVAAVIAVLLVTVWEASVQEMPVIHLGIFLTPFDLVFSCVGLVVLLRLALVPRGTFSLPWSIIALVLVLALSFGVGLSRYGVRAGVEFRGDFYFWSLCLYLMTFRPDQAWIDRVLNLWLLTAFALCLVVWYRWFADAVGLDWITPFWRYADVTSVAFTRVTTSSVALVLGLAMLVSVATLSAGGAAPVHIVFLPALLLTIVFLQHRSVWVATLLPLVTLLLLRGQRPRRSMGPLLAALACIAIVGAVLGSGALGGAAESVAQQAVRATSTTEGTFVARVDGWQALVRRWAGLGPVGLAIGEPYGSGYERHIGNTWGGTTVAFAPHNYFVVLLIRGGIVALLAFVLLLWQLSAAGMTRSAVATVRFGPPMVLAVGMCVALYSIPYSPTPASAVLFGVALCVARQLWRRSTPDAATAAAPMFPGITPPINPRQQVGQGGLR